MRDMATSRAVNLAGSPHSSSELSVSMSVMFSAVVCASSVSEYDLFCKLRMKPSFVTYTSIFLSHSLNKPLRSYKKKTNEDVHVVRPNCYSLQKLAAWTLPRLLCAVCFSDISSLLCVGFPSQSQKNFAAHTTPGYLLRQYGPSPNCQKGRNGLDYPTLLPAAA